MLSTLFIVLRPLIARADGGIVRLHQASGPFLVTLFVSSEVVRAGPADVSVLVQQRTNGDAILDAAVGLTFIPPTGSMSRADSFCGRPSAAITPDLPDATEGTLNVKATREQTANKLLYAAILKLNATGNWRLQLNISRGPDNAIFECVLPVSAASTNLRPLRPYLFLPPIIIAFFAMNQWLRKGVLERSGLIVERELRLRNE